MRQTKPVVLAGETFLIRAIPFSLIIEFGIMFDDKKNDGASGSGFADGLSVDELLIANLMAPTFLHGEKPLNDARLFLMIRNSIEPSLIPLLDHSHTTRNCKRLLAKKKGSCARISATSDKTVTISAEECARLKGSVNVNSSTAVDCMDWISTEIEELLGVSQNVVIRVDCRDKWRWSPREDEKFTVKDLSRLMEEKILVVVKRLFGTNRRGIDVDSVLCPSCNNEVETYARCLTTCGLATSVWDRIFKWKVGDVNVLSILTLSLSFLMFGKRLFGLLNTHLERKECSCVWQQGFEY
nr:hypothetical protein [Tanacetum cinerariifolium]